MLFARFYDIRLILSKLCDRKERIFMCGIVGVISRKCTDEFQIEEIKKMLKAQQHRGPDDSGIVGIDYAHHRGEEIDNNEYFLGKSVVAFNRLSIQDLSINGHQPMMNNDSSVILAFNGEIYNFKELRNELMSKGYQFKSGTDTEVLLNLYLEYGLEKTLIKLNGMYAISIYDMKLDKLFLVRDRFGIKPLYIGYTNQFILYSSEIKSFLEFHEFESKLDEDTLQECILFRNTVDKTLFKNVEQLLPGEICQISMENNEIKKWKYFSLDEYHRLEEKNFKQVTEELFETIKQAVRRQMISDVKVGCQLSGGIDSSLVTYIANRYYGLGDAISVVVDSPAYSEEKYIDYVADVLGIDCHKIILSDKYFLNNIVNTVWHFESVVTHTGMTGVYQLSEEAKKHVTVMLSGEGADEIFGGYPCYLDLALSQQKGNIDQAALDVIMAHGVVDSDNAKKIYAHIDIEKQLIKRKEIYNKFSGTLFDRQVKYEMTTYLPELFVRQDKMSMAFSIENRVPMVDNEVVEYSFMIPQKYLINEGKRQGKDLLKQLSIPIFGKDFAYRKKMGFGVQTNKFLLYNEEFVHNVLKSMENRGILNCNCVSEWNKNILGLRGIEAELFFKMFTFEIWCQLFLDKKKVELSEYEGDINNFDKIAE